MNDRRFSEGPSPLESVVHIGIAAMIIITAAAYIFGPRTEAHASGGVPVSIEVDPTDGVVDLSVTSDPDLPEGGILLDFSTGAVKVYEPHTEQGHSADDTASG